MKHIDRLQLVKIASQPWYFNDKILGAGLGGILGGGIGALLPTGKKNRGRNALIGAGLGAGAGLLHGTINSAETSRPIDILSPRFRDGKLLDQSNYDFVQRKNEIGKDMHRFVDMAKEYSDYTDDVEFNPDKFKNLLTTEVPLKYGVNAFNVPLSIRLRQLLGKDVLDVSRLGPIGEDNIEYYLRSRSSSGFTPQFWDRLRGNPSYLANVRADDNILKELQEYIDRDGSTPQAAMSVREIINTKHNDLVSLKRELEEQEQSPITFEGSFPNTIRNFRQGYPQLVGTSEDEVIKNNPFFDSRDIEKYIATRTFLDSIRRETGAGSIGYFD